jgi:hypothetical protein
MRGAPCRMAPEADNALGERAPSPGRAAQVASAALAAPVAPVPSGAPPLGLQGSPGAHQRSKDRCGPRAHAAAARRARARGDTVFPCWAQGLGGPSDARCASAPQPSAAHERAAGAYCGTPRAARHERRVGRGASRQSRGPRRSSPSGLFPGRRSGAWRPRASRSAAGRSRAAGARRAFAAAAARACACAASGCLASRSGAAAARASAAACARPARLLGAQQRV